MENSRSGPLCRRYPNKEDKALCNVWLKNGGAMTDKGFESCLKSVYSHLTKDNVHLPIQKESRALG